MKFIRNSLAAALLGVFCSGCLFRVDHYTTSPGASGVVLNAQTHAPVSSAIVAVSRLEGYTNAPPASEALAEIRQPIVITGSDGRFSIRRERHSQLVFVPYDEPYFGPGGTLVVRCKGFQPTTVQLWGGIIPILPGISVSAGSTNPLTIWLNPVPK